MTSSGDQKRDVHDSYEKETTSSSDVMNTNEDTKDTDEDESNHSIARSFDEPSSKNQDSESDHNYVNATTKLNHNEYIKPSASVKESYYNIFECGRSVLDKLDVTYQSAFAASEKTAPSAPPVKPPVEWNTQEPSTPPETYTSTLTTPLKNMISKLTGSKQSTSSPVTRAEYISPYKAKYWAVKEKLLREQME